MGIHLRLTFAVIIVFVDFRAHAQLLPPTPPKNRSSLSLLTQNEPTLECNVKEIPNRLMSGVAGDHYRWKEFNVYPDESFTENEREVINDAMWDVWQSVPCISFGIWQPGSNVTGDYVHITRNTTGCWSYIGRLGDRQEMNLQAPECIYVGIVRHEMIHALGFHHEHIRPDRDDYVNIFWENIEPGYEVAFQKNSSFAETYGLPYDYESIMHYTHNAFSRNNESTITAKNGQRVGSKGYLQESDKEKLKRMYKC